MINFIGHKIWKNKWLMLCLILGNIVLIGMVTVVHLFNIATSQRILQEDLRYILQTQNRFPAVMTLSYDFSNASPDESVPKYIYTNDVIWPELLSSMNVPSLLQTRTYTVSMASIRPVVLREIPNQQRHINLVSPGGFAAHLNIIHGRFPDATLVNGNTVEVLALRRAMDANNLIMDELMFFPDITLPNGNQLHLRIVGIAQFAEGSEGYWSAVPFNISNSLLISFELMRELFIGHMSEDVSLSTTWTTVLDPSQMRAASIPEYIRAIEAAQEQLNHSDSPWFYSVNFYETIYAISGRTAQLNVVVLVLQIPIYVMLALFMFMVTKQILSIDANDISVLKSRGASRMQIMSIYGIQGAFVAAVSLPLGIILGMLLTIVIGSAGGFLDLVGRAPLDVEVTSLVIIFAIVGAVISFIYLLLPVLSLSRVAIVESKRKKSRRSDKPIWQRYFLDVLAFAASMVVLYSFYLQRETLMTDVDEFARIDPLLFAGSSLFIIGFALLLLRFYPLLLKLLFTIGKGRLGPSSYASMVKVSRSTGSDQFIMLFLVFTVAIGVFSAQAARTINYNNEHRIRYTGGADIMFREHFRDNLLSPEVMSLFGLPQVETLVYTEPDFNRFLNIPEVLSVTRVMRRDAVLRTAHLTADNLLLMGIETDTFGQTAWFREDFTMGHVNYYLNNLAQVPDGVLLSSNHHHDLGINVGDRVSLQITQRLGPPLTSAFTVVGFVDYWPTYNPISITRLPTGEVLHNTVYLAVANLGELMNNWGVRPYQVWMRTDGVSHRFIHDLFEERSINIVEFNDTQANLANALSDPIIQSTNGVLTIGFIMTMLLCFTGFLIYWILSIKSRQMQFGVFRAIGMSMGGIIRILISEQLLITIFALLLGGLIGEVTSQLFVPLVSLSYSVIDQVIPLRVVIDPMDFVTIYSILGVMLIICLIALIRYTLRVKVTQVLKLGEE